MYNVALSWTEAPRGKCFYIGYEEGRVYLTIEISMTNKKIKVPAKNSIMF